MPSISNLSKEVRLKSLDMKIVLSKLMEVPKTIIPITIYQRNRMPSISNPLVVSQEKLVTLLQILLHSAFYFLKISSGAQPPCIL